MSEGRVGALRPGEEKEKDLGSSPEGLGVERRGSGFYLPHSAQSPRASFAQEEAEHKIVIIK